MNIVVIANCQVQPYHSMLSAISSVSKVVSVPIHLEGTSNFERAKAEMLKVLIEDPEALILTFQLGENFSDLATASLRASYGNVKTFTNIFFDGLHPDCTYLSGSVGRIQSPIGDYHSKIAIRCFFNNASIDECISSYGATSYERLRYFDQFQLSMTELIKRDSPLDIKLGGDLLNCIIDHPSFYTFNHPTSAIFSVAIQKIALSVGLVYPSHLHGYEQNFLSNNTWFPIYPQIAARHDLNYSGSYLFRAPTFLGGRFLDLNEFVSRSYEIYNKERLQLLESKQLKEILSA